MTKVKTMNKDITVEVLLSNPDYRTVIDALSFEQGLSLLEGLVESVESGTLPLDTALASYERGVSVVEHLKSVLTGAEEKLRLLQKPS